MFIYISLFIVTGIFCYLFFAPIYLEINSTKDLYRIRFHYFASVAIHLCEERLTMEIKIFNWTKRLDLLATEQVTDKERVVAKMEKQSRLRNRTWIPWKRISNVLGSFRINSCYITIDTGNVQLNAWLYPFVFWIQTKTKRNISVNFLGKNEIILQIENSLARMSWAYLRSFY